MNRVASSKSTHQRTHGQNGQLIIQQQLVARPNTRSKAQVETQEAPKKSWDIGRFAKTAWTFEYLKPPSPAKVMNKIFGDSAGKEVVPGSMIYSPGANPLRLQWAPLDDVVMGGSSESFIDTVTGAWTGTVITVGGGFTGIRTLPLDRPLDLSRCMGIRLVVKGQGQRFKFIIRDDDQFNGIAWSYSFDTNPFLDTVVKVKLSDFVPTKFAQVVQPAPTLNVATITTLQLTYSKFEYQGKLNPKFKAGDFEFMIKEIDSY